MFPKISALGLALLPALSFASDPANLPVPPSGYSTKKSNVPHGTLSAALSYPSAKYGQLKVKIYTPPGYSNTGTIKYPVLYLHHGIGGNESAWTSSSPGQQEGNADNVLDNLYAENKAKPMIIVLPDGNVRTFTDSFQAFAAFEDVLISDLIPWVEKTYPVNPDRTARAIAGLSMGGGQSFNFGFGHIDKFAYIGPFSAAPNTKRPEENIKDKAATKRDVKLIYIGCGASDGLITNSKMYHDSLDKWGITHIYQIEPAPLAHEREVWNRSLYNFAQRLFTDVATGIVINSKAEGTRAQTLFGLAAKSGTSQILVARPDGKGVFTLDGKAIPASAEASLFEGIRLP